MEYRTKSGKVLTDEDIEKLAAEAEAGYDLAEIRGRVQLGSLLIEAVKEVEVQTDPVIYVHPDPEGRAVVAVVDPKWLDRVWEAATGDGGYEDPSVTDEGRRAKFMPHSHVDPAD